LEFLQLWHPSFLEFLRSNFIGRTILGTSFTWSDFPYYLVGGGIGWLLMKRLQKHSK
jgi:Flp pilus assembly protein TadB